MRFLLYIYFLLATLTTFAQKKYLILEDKSDKTQFAVKEGRWLKVTYHNGMYSEVRYTLIMIPWFLLEP